MLSALLCTERHVNDFAIWEIATVLSIVGLQRFDQ